MIRQLRQLFALAFPSSYSSVLNYSGECASAEGVGE